MLGMERICGAKLIPFSGGCTGTVEVRITPDFNSRFMHLHDQDKNQADEINRLLREVRGHACFFGFLVEIISYWPYKVPCKGNYILFYVLDFSTDPTF